MHTKSIRLIAALLALCLGLTSLTAQSIFPRSTGISFGSSATTGTNPIKLAGTVGDPAVGRSTNTTTTLTSGLLAALKSNVVNQAPRISSDTMVTVRVDESFQYNVIAADREGPVTYKFLNVPSWVQTLVNTNPPMAIGTATKTTGDTTFWVVASDLGGLSDTLKVRVTILTANTPVTITSPKSVTIAEHSRLSYRATVLDHRTLQALSYTNLPSWVRVSADSLTGIAPEGATDTTFRIIATGSSGSDIDTVTIRVTPVNDPPTITSDALKSTLVNTALSYTGTATDPEGAIPAVSFSGLPSWLSAAGATVSGTPTNSTLDTFFLVNATDGQNQVSKRVDVHIQLVNNPPTITSPSVVTATQYRYFSYKITATDPETSPIDLRFSKTSILPSWLSFNEDSIYGTPIIRGIGAVSVIVRVTDGITPITQVVTINVSDSNATPVIARIADTSCSPQASFDPPVKGSDLDTGKLFYTLIKGPSAMTIDTISTDIQSTRLHFQPIDADTGKTYQVIIKVRDRDGASSLDTFDLKVVADPRPRCVLDTTLARSQRGIVKIPFTLFSATKVPINLGLEYRLAPTSPWKGTTAVLGGSNLDSAHYSGTLTWATTYEDALANKRHDSVQIKVTPTGPVPNFDSTTNISKMFKLDNTPSLILNAPVPAPGSQLPATIAPVFTIRAKQGKFDPSTVSDLLGTGTVSMVGTHQGPVPLRIACGDTILTITPNNPLMSSDTFSLILSGTIKDIYGKYIDGNGDSAISATGTEGKSWTYTTGYLGDFTGNDTIDIRDVVKASTYWTRSALKGWKATDSIIEVGPTTGSAPYLALTPDSLFNYRDLNAFMRMWYWMDGRTSPTAITPAAKMVAATTDMQEATARTKAVPYLAKSRDIQPSITSAHPQRQQVSMQATTYNSKPAIRIDLSTNNVSGLAGCRYRIWGSSDAPDISTAGSIMERQASALTLTRTNSTWSEATIARLSSVSTGVSGSGHISSLWMKPILRKGTHLILDYDLISEQGDIIEHGVVDLGVAPVVAEPLILQDTTPTIALISAPNPMTPARNNVAFEIVDRPDALSWINRERAGAIFRFSLNAPKDIPMLVCRIAIRNRNGQVIAVTAEKDLIREIDNQSGSKVYSIYWNGNDRRGVPCVSGVYQVVLTCNNGRSIAEQKFMIGVK